MPVSISGTNGVTFPDSSLQTAAASPYVLKNRIINGAMVIDQRNAGASVTPANLAYTLDRWQAFQSVASKYSVQQNAAAVTPPTGFINYLGCTSLSAYTVGASEAFNIQQRIEGLNVADLAWGTASAATVTLSFWVYSSLTGTFGGFVNNSASTRSYPFSYSIVSANTWTQISVTIVGDTSGTWLTTSGIFAIVGFSLGAGATSSGTAGAWGSTNYRSATGAVSVVGTSGATFYITGVQLEKGSTATSFDYRPYGTELVLCQRYYQQRGGNSVYESFANGFAYTTTQARLIYPARVVMRTTPTLTVSSASNFLIEGNWGGVACTAFSLNQASPEVFSINADVSSGLTTNAGCQLIANNTTNTRLNFSSEL
jgi:hypothetical protein